MRWPNSATMAESPVLRIPGHVGASIPEWALLPVLIVALLYSWMRARRFGRSSEKLAALGLQGRLFDESELETEIAAMEAELERAKADRDKRREGDRKRRAANTNPADRPRRNPLPAHLRRVDIEVDLSDEDLQMMGDDWVCIGFETSEQLAVHEREYYYSQ